MSDSALVVFLCALERPLQGKVSLKFCSGKEKNKFQVGVSELQLFCETENCIAKKHIPDLESQQKRSCHPGLCTVLAVPVTVK